MNHVYSTTAFVLKSFPISESNKKLVLLSRDFGVMRVNAQAVRKMESKLRPMIQDYSRAEFSIVRGNQGWRLINAANSDNLRAMLPKEKFSVLAKVFVLIDRFIPEEDGDSAIFVLAENFVNFLMSETIEGRDLEGFEILTVLKILNLLGYLENKNNLQSVVQMKYSLESIREILRHKAESVRIVNQAIKESHL